MLNPSLSEESGRTVVRSPGIESTAGFTYPKRVRRIGRPMELQDKDKDSPVNGTSAPVFRLMSDS